MTGAAEGPRAHVLAGPHPGRVAVELLRNRVLAYRDVHLELVAGDHLSPPLRRLLEAGALPGGRLHVGTASADRSLAASLSRRATVDDVAGRSGRRAPSGGRLRLAVIELEAGPDDLRLPFGPGEGTLDELVLVASAARASRVDEVVDAYRDRLGPSPRVVVVLGTSPSRGAGRTLVVVPGTGERRGDRHALAGSAAVRVRAAECLCAQEDPVAVLLTGFSGWTDGPSEAEQMRRLWRGPRTCPVLVDEAARDTAENAIFTVPIARAIGDIDRLTVVVSWWNSWRTALFFAAALRGTGIELRLRISWRGGPHGRMARVSLGGIPLMRRHWLEGLRFRAEGPADAAS